MNRKLGLVGSIECSPLSDRPFGTIQAFPLEGSESGQEGISPLTPSSLVGYEVRGLPSRDS